MWLLRNMSHGGYLLLKQGDFTTIVILINMSSYSALVRTRAEWIKNSGITKTCVYLLLWLSFKFKHAVLMQ